jgi:hypothetical protein
MRQFMAISNRFVGSALNCFRKLMPAIAVPIVSMLIFGLEAPRATSAVGVKDF